MTSIKVGWQYMHNWAYGRELPQFMAMEAHPKGTNPVGAVF